MKLCDNGDRRFFAWYAVGALFAGGLLGVVVGLGGGFPCNLVTEELPL